MTSPPPGPDDLTVLVVDDDFMVASIRCRLQTGHPASAWWGSATGATALTEIERLAPDLVLLDVHLPDLSGIDVCAGCEVRQRRRRHDGDRGPGGGHRACRRRGRRRPLPGEAVRVRRPAGQADAFRQARLALSGVATAGQEDIDGSSPCSAGAGRHSPKGLERRDGGSGAGGAGPRLRRLLGRVRREGRDLPGERAATSSTSSRRDAPPCA